MLGSPKLVEQSKAPLEQESLEALLSALKRPSRFAMSSGRLNGMQPGPHRGKRGRREIAEQLGQGLPPDPVLATLLPNHAVGAYRFLIGDRDDIFAPAVDIAVDAMLRVLKTPARAPQAHGYCERFFGTARRERVTSERIQPPAAAPMVNAIN